MFGSFGKILVYETLRGTWTLSHVRKLSDLAAQLGYAPGLGVHMLACFHVARLRLASLAKRDALLNLHDSLIGIAMVAAFEVAHYLGRSVVRLTEPAR